MRSELVANADLFSSKNCRLFYRIISEHTEEAHGDPVESTLGEHAGNRLCSSLLHCEEQQCSPLTLVGTCEACPCHKHGHCDHDRTTYEQYFTDFRIAHDHALAAASDQSLRNREGKGNERSMFLGPQDDEARIPHKAELQLNRDDSKYFRRVHFIRNIFEQMLHVEEDRLVAHTDRVQELGVEQKPGEGSEKANTDVSESTSEVASQASSSRPASDTDGEQDVTMEDYPEEGNEEAEPEAEADVSENEEVQKDGNDQLPYPEPSGADSMRSGGPRRPVLAQSESKARFFERLGLSDECESHRRVYALMKVRMKASSADYHA